MRSWRNKLLEKIRKGLLHAGGILDSYPWHFQSQNRKTHCDAMIIVRFDLRAVHLRRSDFQRVTCFDSLRPALRQLSAKRRDALGLLHTQATQVGKANRLQTKG